jgi:hypothetical protein
MFRRVGRVSDASRVGRGLFVGLAVGIAVAALTGLLLEASRGALSGWIAGGAGAGTCAPCVLPDRVMGAVPALAGALAAVVAAVTAAGRPDEPVFALAGVAEGGTGDPSGPIDAETLSARTRSAQLQADPAVTGTSSAPLTGRVSVTKGAPPEPLDPVVDPNGPLPTDPSGTTDQSPSGERDGSVPVPEPHDPVLDPNDGGPARGSDGRSGRGTTPDPGAGNDGATIGEQSWQHRLWRAEREELEGFDDDLGSLGEIGGRVGTAGEASDIVWSHHRNQVTGTLDRQVTRGIVTDGYRRSPTVDPGPGPGLGPRGGSPGASNSRIRLRTPDTPVYRPPTAGSIPVDRNLGGPGTAAARSTRFGRVASGVARVTAPLKRILGPVGYAIDATRIATAFRMDGNRVGRNTKATVAEVAVGTAIALAGAGVILAFAPGTVAAIAILLATGALSAWGAEQAGRFVRTNTSGFVYR